MSQQFIFICLLYAYITCAFKIEPLEPLKNFDLKKVENSWKIIKHGESLLAGTACSQLTIYDVNSNETVAYKWYLNYPEERLTQVLYGSATYEDPNVRSGALMVTLDDLHQQTSVYVLGTDYTTYLTLIIKSDIGIDVVVGSLTTTISSETLNSVNAVLQQNGIDGNSLVDQTQSPDVCSTFNF